MICHVAYDAKPLTRSERARNAKRAALFERYEGVARQVLETLLDKYSTANLVDLDDPRVLGMEEFRQFGSPMVIVEYFGGRQEYLAAAQELEDVLYAA